MKLVLRIVAGLFGLFILAIIGGYVYIKTALPNAGPVPQMVIASSSEQIERGKYLANHVAVCTDCHSKRDYSFFAGPLKPETFGAGGEEFPESMGFPGTLYARNITPAGLKDWTDGEIFHALTTGIRKNREPIFPLMPWHRYATSDKEDILSIIAYIKTLKPIENQVPETRLNFPLNLIVRTMPKAPAFVTRPDTTDEVAYGKYLANMAACADCHTMTKKGEPLPGMDFAGGFQFKMPQGVLRSANITPDEKTGIGSWTREQFINRFKTYTQESAQRIPVPEPYTETQFQTIMPWIMYAGMTEKDLGAIYAYLRSVKAVDHPVKKFTVN
ncbi:MAG TPA: c-type cytochrome [bacterium]|nr:c-type cytochrome [bacterium]HNJ72320.1 c-type cytochrome [bacterium]